ncbi:MAG TPA: MmcQ/YjbR family DNA-binding protein [Trueperaceae bacterium]
MSIATLAGLRAYCALKPGARETYPFGPETPVFKVAGKMFALASAGEGSLSLSLKCEPDLAELLRDKYAAVTPGYHLNKRHWNSIKLDGSLPEAEVRELIDLSYELVVAGLSRKLRAALA